MDAVSQGLRDFLGFSSGMGKFVNLMHVCADEEHFPKMSGKAMTNIRNEADLWKSRVWDCRCGQRWFGSAHPLEKEIQGPEPECEADCHEKKSADNLFESFASQLGFF